MKTYAELKERIADDFTAIYQCGYEDGQRSNVNPIRYYELDEAYNRGYKDGENKIQTEAYNKGYSDGYIKASNGKQQTLNTCTTCYYADKSGGNCDNCIGYDHYESKMIFDNIKLGDEVNIHGYVDEIRKDVIIIKNEGGYFGTVPSEIRKEK